MNLTLSKHHFYGNDHLSEAKNIGVLNATVKYLMSCMDSGNPYKSLV